MRGVPVLMLRASKPTRYRFIDQTCRPTPHNSSSSASISCSYIPWFRFSALNKASRMLVSDSGLSRKIRCMLSRWTESSPRAGVLRVSNPTVCDTSVKVCGSRGRRGRRDWVELDKANGYSTLPVVIQCTTSCCTWPALQAGRTPACAANRSFHSKIRSLSCQRFAATRNQCPLPGVTFPQITHAYRSSLFTITPSLCAPHPRKLLAMSQFRASLAPAPSSCPPNREVEW
jgi:hypothetical protein